MTNHDITENAQTTQVTLSGTSETEFNGTFELLSANNRRTFEFEHPLSDIVTSLIDAGLRIEFLHEFPFTAFEAPPGVQKADDGYFHLPSESPKIPLLFSLRATKP